MPMAVILLEAKLQPRQRGSPRKAATGDKPRILANELQLNPGYLPQPDLDHLSNSKESFRKRS